MQINTVQEQDAYDKGFADGKDYWTDLAEERIIKLLEDFQYYGITHELNDDFCKELITLINGKEND